MNFKKRTDKGVSAIGNVASLKCINPANLTELVNAHLPSDIRITGVRRFAFPFDKAKNGGERNQYFYFFSVV